MHTFLKKILLTAAMMVAAVVAYAAGPVARVGERPKSGLDGRTIALWNSHGLYYKPEMNKWIYQRAHLHETIEDLYTSTYVLELLVPMLEDAGAYVMIPRERDLSDVEVIIDADSRATPGYKEHNGAAKWTPGGTGFVMPSKPLTGKDNPFRSGSYRKVASTTSSKTSSAEWNAPIPAEGEYAVYISYASLPESASDVKYTVNSRRGSEEFVVNQTMGGGTWIYLGTFPLAEGLSEKPIVTLSNRSATAGKVVTADAVKIGGGMGNVARSFGKETPTVSGHPRWMEAARYWLQWAGAPIEVVSPSDFETDYKDDIHCRPHWVNWLAGGSIRNPREKGLNIPVDISLAIHTDAGVTPDSTVQGTLAIYCTDGGRKLGDGRRRTANRVLTQSVTNSLVNDIRALHEPIWKLRGIKDKRYVEARVPVVPATLIEILSHQNFADMRHGLNPEFRFDVCRAIYKGILRYFYNNNKKPFIVTPLPVNSFAIRSLGDGKYRLSWRPTDDPLEESAVASSYIIEQRMPGDVFKRVAETSATEWDYAAPVGMPVSFRIIARNDGGVSFPSEVLGLCHFDNDYPEVLIVNGFTRVSAPDWIETDSIAGFLDELDYGVPYKRNIAYSGRQYDFDRLSEWQDDSISPGVGASYGNFDGRPVAGNTFDFVDMHGRALAKARYPYVSVSLAAFTDSAFTFTNRIVDLILGKQKEIQPGNANSVTKFKPFTPALEQRLDEFTAGGGSLLVSGEFIATDLFTNPFSSAETIDEDIRFATNVLGIELQSAFASLSGRVRALPFWGNKGNGAALQFSAEPNSLRYAAGAVDAIAPTTPKGFVIATYAESSAPAIVASHHRAGKVITSAFPIEAIFNQDQIDYLLDACMRYLTPRRVPAPVKATLPPVDIHSVIPTPDSLVTNDIVTNDIVISDTVISD